MAISIAMLLSLGLATQAQPTCEQTAPALQHQAAVHVGVQEEWRGYSAAAEELREVFRCYSRALVVVDSPFDADIHVRVTFRAHHSKNVQLTHQMGIAVSGRGILPSSFTVGARTWDACGHTLARRLIELLRSQKGPRGRRDDVA